MSQITVLQILHSMNVGGAELLAAGLARKLQDRYRFIFACLDEVGELGNSLMKEGFQLEVLNRKSGFDRRCARALRSLYKETKADVLHAHQYTPFFYALAAGHFGRRPPVLFTEHGRFHPDVPSSKRFVFNRTLLRKKDHIVAVGNSVRQALIDNEGLPANRIEVVYNGIDLARFTNLEQDSSENQFRSEMNFKSDDFIVSLVGRLDSIKDHLTAIRTAERVTKSCANFHMLFVGDGSERAKLESEIQERKLQNRVHLLGTRHDIPQILQASNVCFLSSISEGIPLTLIEGMAASLPVVATNVGGVSEIVLSNQTGFLADAADAETLANHIIKLAQDQQLRKEFGQAGRQRAQELFSEKLMHEKYDILYQKLAGLNSDCA